MTTCPIERPTLYLHRLDDNRCLSHDGYIQLGIFNHSVEKQIELNPNIRWVETYWKPDNFGNRYKRASLLAHERKNAGKPPTDNRADSRPRDLTKPKGCVTLQEEHRLERTL